jgi:hypothetical protein
MAHPKKRASNDVALLYAPTEDGKGARVLRSRAGVLEAGEVRPMKEGEPIQRGEVVKLTPREDAACVCDVEVVHQPPAAEADAGGRPAQVATEGYRSNWDRIFGSRAKRDRSLN